MSSNNRIVFLILVIFFNFLNAQSIPNQKNNHDALILLALDYEINQHYNKSAKIYNEIFNKTKNQEYLQKAITQYLVARNFDDAGKLCVDNLDKFKDEDEKFYRLAVVSLINQGKLDKALKISLKLLKKYNNSINYEVVANVYYAQGNYKESLKYFESAYALTPKASTLIFLVDVLYVYSDEKQKAISYLKTYIKKFGCKYRVCNKLISFYREQNDLDGMISILKLEYKTITNKHYSYKLLKLLVSSLEQKDINLAIEFLEKEKVDNTKLLLLYERAGDYKKALKLVRKIYKKTKKKALLGQIAILEFEMAKDKKSIMKHVLANFEIAIKATNNPAYKNYYGYLLIDYDINVKKGLKLVKEALKTLPNNMAFMDSVAWGYYKLKQCDKAYTYMSKVINQIGLENDEIKLHWEKIQECKSISNK